MNKYYHYCFLFVLFCIKLNLFWVTKYELNICLSKYMSGLEINIYGIPDTMSCTNQFVPDIKILLQIVPGCFIHDDYFSTLLHWHLFDHKIYSAMTILLINSLLTVFWHQRLLWFQDFSEIVPFFWSTWAPLPLPCLEQIQQITISYLFL